MDGSKTSAQEFENAIKQGSGALDEMRAKAEQNEEGFGAWLLGVDVSQHFEDLPALLDKAATAGRGFWSSMSFNENAALDTLREFGTSLSTLAASDLPRAQHAFAQFYREAGLNEAQALTALNEEMPLFKSQLIDAAEAAELATDDATLLKLALGELGPATDRSGDSAKSAAADYMEQANAARAAADELFNLLDALMEQNNVAQNAESSNARYQQTLADVAEYIAGAQAGLEGYSASIDQYTVAGSKNRDMFAGLASDSQRMAQAYMEQEVATVGVEQAAANYNYRLGEGRQALIDQITALTGNYDAAVELADAIYKIPTEHETKILVETAAATAQINNWMDAMPKVLTVQAQVEWQAANNPDAFVSMTRADGGFHSYANGGMHEFANGGGIGPGIFSGGTPLIKFAEPETNWEAFISGKAGQEARNREVWVESGNRLGAFEDIGKHVAQGLAEILGKELPRGSAGTTIYYTSVNPVVRDDFQDAWEKGQEGGGFG